MAKNKDAKSENEHEIASELNRAHDAFNTGDFISAIKHANRVLHSEDLDPNSYVLAQLVHLQIRERQGAFQGLLVELEELFNSDPLMHPSVQAKVGNQIIRVCHRSENLVVGTQRGEEMLREFYDRWPVTEVVELLCQLAACHFYRSDSERALDLAARAQVLAEKSHSPKSIAQSYWQLAAFSAHSGNLAQSLAYNREARHWAATAEMGRLLPILNSNEAAMLLEMPDQDLEPIHQMAESAYLELISYNDPGAATYACVTLSEVELRQSNYEGAHFYVDKGLLELPAEIPGPRISLLIQRARVFARSGDYSQSQDFVEEAIAMMESAAPSTTLANSWALVARVLVEIGLAERGIYAYEQAIQVAGILREEPEIQIK